MIIFNKGYINDDDDVDRFIRPSNHRCSFYFYIKNTVKTIKTVTDIGLKE